jgi:poly-gamma-glutamate synthesis protein (capsule biosynthesis protein)
MMDYGDMALLDTVKALDGWAIRHAGAGGNIEAARAPARVQIGSTDVIVLAYCAFGPSPMHATDDGPGVALLDTEQIRADLAVHKKDDNVVLVSLHWGVQHTDHATQHQRKLAREILDAGADAIIGHHPHRPQGLEVHDGKVIAYSVGNFLFGYYNPVYTNNIALVLEFEGSKIVGARVLPVDGKNARIRFRPKFMTGKKGLDVLEHVGKLSERFGTMMTVESDAASIDLAASM